MVWQWSQVHQQLDMAVVAILSHGENGSIICTNGEKVIIQLFHCDNHNWSSQNTRCPSKTYSASSTIGKPRRWRGNPSSSSSSPAAGSRLTPEWTRTGWTTTGWSGWTGWSTITQTSSKGFLTGTSRSLQETQVMRTSLSPMQRSQLMWRTETTWKAPGKDGKETTWPILIIATTRFVQCLCKVFMKHSCEEDLVSLLARVTQQLKTYCTSRGEKQVDIRNLNQNYMLKTTCFCRWTRPCFEEWHVVCSSTQAWWPPPPSPSTLSWWRRTTWWRSPPSRLRLNPTLLTIFGPAQGLPQTVVYFAHRSSRYL